MEISLAALLEIPSILKLLLYFCTPLTLGTCFSQEDTFLPGDLVIGLGVLVKAMDVVWTFLIGEYKRVASAMWVSLVSLVLHFPEEPCLSPDLSG